MVFGIISWKTLIFLCVGIFAANFVDAIAGGGGVISVPVYMLTGLPMQNVYACNKLTAAMGTTFASFKYIKEKAVNWVVAVISAVCAVIGARIATVIFMNTSSDTMKKIVVCVLPFAAAFLLLKRDFGEQSGFEELPKNKVYIISALTGLLVAFYDGLIGPGTGTIAMMIFSSVLKLDLKTSSGTAKVFNLASNWSSAISFMIAGYTIWPLALTTTVFSILGGRIGAALALKKGTKFIKIIMTVVIVMLLIKLAADIF